MADTYAVKVVNEENRPKFVPLHKTPNMQDTLDWVIIRASRTPGPGQYYKDDILDSIRGGGLAKAKAKTAVDWECYRASKIPAPCDYYKDDTSDSISGGVMAKGKAKTAVEWEMYRASQIPGPDYDLEKSWRYIDGTSRGAGASMSSRMGPAKLPYPYEKFSVPKGHKGLPAGGDQVAHDSHAGVLTPWREPDWSQRKKEAGIALGKARKAAHPGANGPVLEDSYLNSLTPWRDQAAERRQRRLADQSPAAAAVTASASSAAASSPGGVGGDGDATAGDNTGSILDGATTVGQDGLTLSSTSGDKTPKNLEDSYRPWRDKDAWSSAQKEVMRMRRHMALVMAEQSERMEARPPFGGGAGPLARSSGKKKPKSFPASGERPASASAAGKMMDAKGKAAASKAKAARFAKHRHSKAMEQGKQQRPSTAGAASSRRGGSAARGPSTSWRLNLIDRANSFSAPSFFGESTVGAKEGHGFDGEEVETSIIMIQSEPSFGGSSSSSSSRRGSGRRRRR